MNFIAKALFKVANANCYSIDIPTFRANGCDIVVRGSNNGIEVCINTNMSGDGKEEILWDTFSIVYDLLFVAVGSFPQLTSIMIDDSSVDLTKLAHKYTTAEAFKVDCFRVLNINSSLINSESIDKMKEINRKPLWSLEYIVSEAYSKVATVHKTALLLHTAEGLCNSIDTQDVSFISKMEAVFESFFRYQESESLIDQFTSSFGETSDKFYKFLVDTRDDITHYLEEIDKTRSTRNKELSLDRKANNSTIYMWELLFCIYIAIRLYIAEHLCFTILDNNVKESMYRIQDWMYIHKCERCGTDVDATQLKSRSSMVIYIRNSLGSLHKVTD